MSYEQGTAFPLSQPRYCKNGWYSEQPRTIQLLLQGQRAGTLTDLEDKDGVLFGANARRAYYLLEKIRAPFAQVPLL